MRPMLIGAPAVEPLSLAEAKSWLRDDNADEDQLLQTLIVSARMTLEAYTRRFFITQHWRLTLDAWPTRLKHDLTLAIPFAPFQAVSAIRVYSDGNDSSLIDPLTYRAPAENDFGRIIFTSAPPAPSRKADGVEIDFIVGYGDDPQATPAPLRQAMLALVAHWQENRGDAAEAVMPFTAMQYAAPFRRARLT